MFAVGKINRDISKVSIFECKVNFWLLPNYILVPISYYCISQPAYMVNFLWTKPLISGRHCTSQTDRRLERPAGDICADAGCSLSPQSELIGGPGGGWPFRK